MCRLLGIVANERTHFRLCLHEAPRSLAKLSQEHPHGWGVAIYSPGQGWSVQKRTDSAHLDDQFHDMAAESYGDVLIAHVRKRTMGPISLRNTHPFQRGRWVFAHNGTLRDLDFLSARTSPQRRAEIEGDTDSERLFAFLLTALDEAGAADAPASPVTDAALLGAVRAVRARPGLGASNFLLSDGDTCYVHRAGRTLFLLERVPGDQVRRTRVSAETGAIIETPWSAARHAILLASEQITHEPWQPVPEEALLRVDRRSTPVWRALG